MLEILRQQIAPLTMTQSQIEALEQRMNDKQTDLENKLNHVKEFVILENNEVKQQLVNIEKEITIINARDIEATNSHSYYDSISN